MRKLPGNREIQRPGKHTARNCDRRNWGTANRPKRERHRVQAARKEAEHQPNHRELRRQ